MNAPSKAGRWVAGILLTLVLIVGGCVAANSPSSNTGQSPKPTPTTIVDRKDRSPKPAPSVNSSPINQKSVSGAKLNKFFPSASSGYNIVFQQEKKGFAEAKLKKSGQDLAMLSINDVANNPSAVAKFKNSSDEIDGYPSVEVGKNQTSVLVGDRYQVKARSLADDFSPSDREDWIEKFNLSGLSRLK